MKSDLHTAAFEGVVVGRVQGEEICLRGDRGATISFRVAPALGAQLDLGRRAVVELDATGRARSARLVGDLRI
jgi:hypothetical protein